MNVVRLKTGIKKWALLFVFDNSTRFYSVQEKKISQHIRVRKGFLFMFKLLIIIALFPMSAAAQSQNPVVRIAKLRIDSVQLDSYKVALKAEIEASLRNEAGVLTLYAVSDKNNPTHITVFEIYANQAAYLAHLETPHFKKYKSTTKAMVQSLELMDSVPIALESKPKTP